MEELKNSSSPLKFSPLMTGNLICVKKIKIAVEKNKKSQKAPYKTTTQNGASLLETIVGRLQWCFIFWDSFGNRETPNLSEGPLSHPDSSSKTFWRE